MAPAWSASGQAGRYSLAAAATSGPGASDRQHLEAELEREQLRDAADNLLLTRHIGGRAYSS